MRLWEKYTSLGDRLYQGLQRILSFLEGKPLGPHYGVCIGTKTEIEKKGGYRLMTIGEELRYREWLEATPIVQNRNQALLK
jgi:hypothetical protein